MVGIGVVTATNAEMITKILSKVNLDGIFDSSVNDFNENNRFENA